MPRTFQIPVSAEFIIIIIIIIIRYHIRERYVLLRTWNKACS
jgi:hypothetical protein